MNSRGNKKIGKMKRYSKELRERITEIILRERAGAGKDMTQGDEFAELCLKALKKEGFKSPDGKPLTLRGVRYQILRSGIRFQGFGYSPPPVPSAPVEKDTDREEILGRLGGLPRLVEAILEDTSLSADQKVKWITRWKNEQKGNA
jgi:hypothetical protein